MGKIKCPFCGGKKFKKLKESIESNEYFNELDDIELINDHKKFTCLKCRAVVTADYFWRQGEIERDTRTAESL